MYPYKLAKQLKDAGFPQPKYFTAGNYYEKNGEMILIPTLPELIKECGDRFVMLVREKKNCWCVFGKISFEDVSEEIRGKTHKEAVTKLLLKLYKGRKK